MDVRLEAGTVENINWRVFVEADKRKVAAAKAAANATAKNTKTKRKNK